MLSFREFSRLCPPDAASHTTDYLTIAATSVAMYRLQQTGDPLVIAEAAGAIITLTVAKTLARGFELVLARLFGLPLPRSGVGPPADATPAGAPDDADQRQLRQGCSEESPPAAMTGCRNREV